MNKKEKILQEYDESAKLYENFSNKIGQVLKEIIDNEKISYNAITCRLKTKDSLSKKIDAKQNKYGCLGDLTDIAGVRIITYYSNDVDRIIDIVEKEFEVDEENSIDKRKALGPDRFGYCSVHYIVGLNSERLKLRENQQFKGLKCEIQIRTVLQHAWAEIEHDLGYKSEIGIPEEIRRNFSRLAGLLEIGDKEFLEIRNYLESYSSRIIEKIYEEELDDNKLDAIILNEFTKTDRHIIDMNKQIAKYFNYQIGELDSFSTDFTIKQLAWFGVTTLGELKQLLFENKDFAIQIANKIAASKSASQKGGVVEPTRAIFYLCYAELLKRYDDEAALRRYFNEVNISASSDFANQLLNIKKQLNM